MILPESFAVARMRLVDGDSVQVDVDVHIAKGLIAATEPGLDVPADVARILGTGTDAAAHA